MTGKLVLVTGGAGFIGSHLAERLHADGNRVISLDNYFAGSRDNHVAGVEYRAGHTKDIEKHVTENPDIIFHLGEYSRVEQSVLEQDIVADLNTEGTNGVIAFWKKKKCKLVYAGSSTKFGDGGAARHTSPYASTKADNTEKVKRVGDAEHLPYAITYFYNVYGPRERSGIYGTVVETFKHMYRSGSPMAVTSPGTQTRNFTHVADIVDALLLVGEKGDGDEFGLGHERSYSILELAHLFKGDIVMMPPRSASRMTSGLDTTKIRALGWTTKHDLESYVADFIATEKQGKKKEKRVLVFSTTFYPTIGPAEEALIALMKLLPDVAFDIVTTKFIGGVSRHASPTPNATIYRVGFGFYGDKYLLPLLGYRVVRKLHRTHNYMFAWSLMASYAALLGILAKRFLGLPLLVTLADHNISEVRKSLQAILRFIVTDADQVYGIESEQELRAKKFVGPIMRRSIGEGDAFANQLRYAYADTMLQRRRLLATAENT